MRVKDQVALVTGAGRGIGRATALLLAKEGADLALCDIVQENVESVGGEVEALGRRVLTARVDVARRDEVDGMVSQTIERFSRIDILVNNAGIGGGRVSIDQLSEADWDRMLEVNLKSTLICSQAVLGQMVKQGSGRIVNIASMAGQVGGVLASAHYSVSKAGVICLTKSLAKFGGPCGIRVNCISPSQIDTEMIKAAKEADLANVVKGTPLQRLGKPEDVANTVLFLASDESSFITGQNIGVNGGIFMP